MPLFYLPKPRQFRYQPRFYDPEKERWEALKMKYQIEHSDTPLNPESTENANDSDSSELAYFQQRLREIDREKHHKDLTWKDMFRKREMPKFHYEPRFANAEERTENEEQPSADNSTKRLEQYKKEHTKIKRRFDFHSTFERKQRKPWLIVAVVVVGFYIVYRYYGDVIQFLYKLFF
jgi:hypothetical protein